MAMTSQQKGLIGEWEVAKLLMMGSDGRLAVTFPMAIDAGYDLRVHIRGSPEDGLALQVKIVTHLRTDRRSQSLWAAFYLPNRPFVVDPRLWFLFGHLEMAPSSRGHFASPLFLVPSQVIGHRVRAGSNGRQSSYFWASMRPDRGGVWTPYRATPESLATTVRDLIRRLALSPPTSAVNSGEG
jgi:hypothetical protein